MILSLITNTYHVNFPWLPRYNIYKTSMTEVIKGNNSIFDQNNRLFFFSIGKVVLDFLIRPRDQNAVKITTARITYSIFIKYYLMISFGAWKAFIACITKA